MAGYPYPLTGGTLVTAFDSGTYRYTPPSPPPPSLMGAAARAGGDSDSDGGAAAPTPASRLTLSPTKAAAIHRINGMLTKIPREIDPIDPAIFLRHELGEYHIPGPITDQASQASREYLALERFSKTLDENPDNPHTLREALERLQEEAPSVADFLYHKQTLHDSPPHIVAGYGKTSLIENIDLLKDHGWACDLLEILHTRMDLYTLHDGLILARAVRNSGEHGAMDHYQSAINQIIKDHPMGHLLDDLQERLGYQSGDKHIVLNEVLAGLAGLLKETELGTLSTTLITKCGEFQEKCRDVLDEIAAPEKASEVVRGKHLYVAAEIQGSLKTGGLANAVSELAKGMKDKGEDVEIMIPLFKRVGEFNVTTHENVAMTVEENEIVLTLADASAATRLEFEAKWEEDGKTIIRQPDQTQMEIVLDEDGTATVTTTKLPAVKGVTDTGETVNFSFSGAEKAHRVFEKTINDVRVLLVDSDHERYEVSGRSPYESYKGDPADEYRWVDFSEAVTSWIHQNREEYHSVNFQDAHGALAARRLKEWDRKNYFAGNRPALIYTIHNLGIAAQRPTSNMELLRMYGYNLGEGQTELNTAVEAMNHVDHIVVVSEQHAKELQDKRNYPNPDGYGDLSSIVRAHAHRGRVSGIANGSDSRAWRSGVDPVEGATQSNTYISLSSWESYRAEDVVDLSFNPDDDIQEKKLQIKQELNAFLELDPHFKSNYTDPYQISFTDAGGNARPVVTYVGRFDSSQKGTHRFIKAAAAAKAAGATFVCMGKGTDATAKGHLEELQAWAKANAGPDWGGALIMIDEDLSLQLGEKAPDGTITRPGIGTLLRAATDFGFFPSIYEPCGLVQKEAYHFGSMVIASRKGGFVDTVRDDTDDTRQGFLVDAEFDDEQYYAKTLHALNWWKTLTTDQQNEYAKKMIEEERKNSWITAAHGRSPVDRHLGTIDAAAATKRSI